MDTFMVNKFISPSVTNISFLVAQLILDHVLVLSIIDAGSLVRRDEG